MKNVFTLVPLLTFLSATLAFGHARLIPGTAALATRSTNPGVKVGPCGGLAKNGAPNVYMPGQQVLIQWEETIDHPGHYRIAFAPSGDAGFDQNILADLLPDMQGGVLPHAYSKMVTIPSTPCASCSLQLIQYMTEVTPPSLYFSCADIVILQANGQPPAPAPLPSPTPALGDCK